MIETLTFSWIFMLVASCCKGGLGSHIQPAGMLESVSLSCRS